MLESLFNKVAILQLYLKETPTLYFPVKLVKFPRKPNMKNICERLLLYLKWMDGAFVDNLFSSWQEIETYKGRIF